MAALALLLPVAACEGALAPPRDRVPEAAPPGVPPAAEANPKGAEPAAAPDSALCSVAETMPSDLRGELRGLCAQVESLGRGSFAELGILPPGKKLESGFSAGAEGVDALAGQRAVWRYAGTLIATARLDDAARRDVLFAARALRQLQVRAPGLHAAIEDARRYSAPARLGAFKNRIRELVVSFDRTPEFIAAQTTLLDPAPKRVGKLSTYDNVVVLSIDTETIRGERPDRGSRLIYRRAAARDNYEQYMRDGLIYSIGHEFLHIYFDQHKSTSQLAQAVAAARSSRAGADAEEAVVIETALRFLGSQISQAARNDAQASLKQLLASAQVREALVPLCKLTNEPTGVVGYHCPTLP